MQAVLLLDDYRLLRNVNAFLRAFGIAQFTADTFIGHKIANSIRKYSIVKTELKS